MSTERRAELRGVVTAKDLAPGAIVDYYSSSKGGWVPIRIKQVNNDTGAIELDLRGGTWLKKEDQPGKLCRHITPGRASLDWIRETLGSDRFATVQFEYFKRHSTGHMGQFVVLDGASMSALAHELDCKLGTVGSIEVLLKEAGPGKSLTLTKFEGAFWKLLDRTLRDHSGAIHVKRTMVCKGERSGQEYEVEKELGRGAFGKVNQVRERSTGARLAVKEISKGASLNEIGNIEAEVAHLCRVDHPNIVKLRRFYEDDENMYLVMDFCTGGDLKDWLQGRQRENFQKPTDDLVLHLMSQVMRAVAHVHTRGIVHLDIKSVNIMLTHSSQTVAPVRGQQVVKQDTSRPHLMLIDLGVAQFFRPGERDLSIAGTPGYMAPEMWAGEATPAADVWSCGMVLYELCTLSIDPVSTAMKLPSEPDSAMIACATRFWMTGGSSFNWAVWPALNHLPPSALQLVQSMLSLKRQDRPSARGSLDSEFLRRARPRIVPLHQQDQKVRDLVRQFFKYENQNVLYKSIAVSIALKWQSNQCPTAQKVFTMLDTAGGGLLDLRGASEAFVDLGLLLAPAQELVKAMDLNKDGFVDWTEFLAASICLGDPVFEEVLEQHFKKAAAGHACIYDRKQLASILPGYTEGDVEVVELFKQLSPREDGITWQAFKGQFSQMSL